MSTLEDTLAADPFEVMQAVEFGDENDYGPPIGGDPDVDVSRETSEINTPPRRRPGPPPNPNSARSKRRAAKAATPRKRATPNAPAAPAAAAAEPDNVYERGAIAILGWAARPLAMAGLGLNMSAMVAPTMPDGALTKRALKLARHGEALSLDAITLTLNAEPLAKGAAGIAGNVPWMARALENAAKVSPVAALVEAASGIALQMLANHGLLPVSRVLGTFSPAELRAAAGLDEPGMVNG